MVDPHPILPTARDLAEKSGCPAVEVSAVYTLTSGGGAWSYRVLIGDMVGVYSLGCDAELNVAAYMALDSWEHKHATEVELLREKLRGLGFESQPIREAA